MLRLAMTMTSAAVLTAVLSSGVAGAQWTVIAQQGEPVPEGDAVFGTLLNPSLNNAGQVVFSAVLDAADGGWLGERGLYMHDGALAKLMRTGDALPGGDGVFDFPGVPVLNGAGQVAFTATLDDTPGGWFVDDEALYLHDGAALLELARADDVVPEGGGRFESFETPAFNDAGQVAFGAALRHTTGGWLVDDEGLYLHDGAALTNVARTGDAAPGGSELFDWLGAAELSGGGHVAFRAGLRDPGDESPAGEGVYLHDAAGLSELVRTGEMELLEHWNPNTPAEEHAIVGVSRVKVNAAGGVLFHATLELEVATRQAVFMHDGAERVLIAADEQLAFGAEPGASDEIFVGFDASAINDAGRVALAARLPNDEPFEPNVRPALYLSDEQVQMEIARGGDATPRGGVFGDFSDLAVLAGGQVVFKSAAGLDEAGIYLADGAELVELVRTGDAFGSINIERLIGPVRANDHGQVVFVARSDGQRVLLSAAPTLNWRGGAAGDWDEPDNWTLGLSPAAPHRLVVERETAVSIAGPADDAAVLSLTLGGDEPGAGAVTLSLGAGDLAASEHVHLRGSGQLVGGGRVATPVLVNDGAIELSPASVLTIDGDYEQGGDGSLRLEVDAGGAGRVEVGGVASLAGGLEVVLDGARPESGSVLAVVLATGINGAFDAQAVSLPGEDWALHYGDEAVALSYQLLVGDMNRDGVVDTGDVAPFVLGLTNRQAYIDTYGIDPAFVGDINGDGAFDTGDVAPFVQLLVGDGASVPEPGTAVLMGVGVLGLLRRRRAQALGWRRTLD